MTIKDIAREAGYAVGTVSRVLNNHPDVSEKARTRILAVVEKNGFVLNTNAKNLKQQVSSNILVLVKGTHNELFAALVEELQRLMAGSSYTILTEYFEEDENEVTRAIALCAEKKPLGILFLGGYSENFMQDFSRIHVPAVLVTAPGAALGFENLSSVCTDDRAAAAAAMQYLLDHGHRHIAMIGGRPERSDVTSLRYAGGRDAFCASGLPPENLVEYGEARYSYREGYEAMCRVLQEAPQVTAVFAVADVVAIGAMRAIRDHGTEPGQRISLMGFDGLEIGSYLTPRLATIRQPVPGLAAHALAILRESIEEKRPARHEIVPFELILGESVGCCP